MPELSGIEVVALIRELGCSLRGTYVNNVYSIGEAQVVRFRRPGCGDIWVVLSARHGCWASAKVSERAETTPFTSSLRHEIDRARLEDVSQVDLDRVYDFAFRIGDETKHLIVELMPPGNLLVTGGDGRIKLALREARTGVRRIARGGAYARPVQRRASPENVTGADVVRMLRSEKTLGQALGRNLALPRKYVREVLFRLSLTEGAPAADEVSRSDEIASAIRRLVEEARSAPHPCLAETPEGSEPFALRPGSAVVIKESEVLGDICDEVLLPQIIDEVDVLSREGRSKKGELESTLEGLRRQEADLLGRASHLRELAGRAALSLTVEEASILLREAGGFPRSREMNSPAAFSSQIYTMAKELEQKSEEVHEAAGRIAKRLSKEKTPVTAAAKELRREKREWYEKFRWFFTSGGKLAIGGRDAQSNSLLVRRHIDDNDTVYHADIFGSPFFVLKGGKGQTEEESLELAQATVSFSSAWKTGLTAADAYWVPPGQVGKAAPSGEYLVKGSFMILGKKNTLRKVLVELAVGLDLDGRVVAGPETAIARRSRGYVVLVPHREKASETAKKIVRELEPLGLRRSTSVDEVLRALPAGGGKVVRRKTIETQSPDNL